MGSAEDRAPVILFVDDNAALLQSIQRLLVMEGFTVLLANNGQEALNILGTADPLPELIISDVMMPVMDGFELFAAVREHREWLDIQFLFLTARDQIEDLERAYDLGADDYLVKPFQHERLVLIVRGKLKRRREWKSHIEDQQALLDQAKSQLAMLVAHELRTPLVSITMVTDILAREMTLLDPDQIAMMLDTMQGGSLRLNRLVEQMVMYVQAQSGALHNAIQRRVRMNPFRDIVIGSVDRARQFAYRQNEVPVRFEELDGNVMIGGDLAALQHALAEVLANAMGFTQSDSAIFVRLWSGEGFGWFCAADRGPGIPAHEQQRVFEPFYQVNRAHYEQQGIGLGLTLVRSIIEAHGGVVELQSTEGYGTEVRIGLPLRNAEDR